MYVEAQDLSIGEVVRIHGDQPARVVEIRDDGATGLMWVRVCWTTLVHGYATGQWYRLGYVEQVVSYAP